MHAVCVITLYGEHNMYMYIYVAIVFPTPYVILQYIVRVNKTMLAFIYFCLVQENIVYSLVRWA